MEHIRKDVLYFLRPVESDLFVKPIIPLRFTACGPKRHCHVMPLSCVSGLQFQVSLHTVYSNYILPVDFSACMSMYIHIYK